MSFIYYLLFWTMKQMFKKSYSQLMISVRPFISLNNFVESFCFSIRIDVNKTKIPCFLSDG